MPRLLVLDFDGTVTDAEREGAPFREGYLSDIATLTGLSRDEVEELARRFEAEIAADPQSHGWMYGGRIVAPATVDPYLRIMPVARKIFDEVGAFSREQDRTHLLDGILYKYNYPKTEIAFRDGGAEVLGALGPDGDLLTYVVTNSHTDAVQHKIRVLGGPGGALDWLVDRVHGRAKKYVIHDDWTAVPESMTLPGLGRPVLLRRQQYHDVIAALLDRHGLGWSDLVVVGDIFELDLCLPFHMGARVAVMANAHTPAYETDFLRGHARGGVLTHMDQIPAFARG
ncbi:MAG: hypothetical protein H6742_20670 [Alphaproteobacteria bacterium]|nr:hypothetical protein [Alphaproteobacteria bacterium]